MLVGLMMLVISNSGNEQLLKLSEHKTEKRCLLAKKDYSKLQSNNVIVYCVDMDTVGENR